MFFFLCCGHLVFSPIWCNEALYVFYLLLFSVFNCSNRDKEDDSPVVEQFIARKADLLFAPSWKSTTPGEDEWQEETQGYSYTVQIHIQAVKHWDLKPPLDNNIHILQNAHYYVPKHCKCGRNYMFNCFVTQADSQ